jgi:hypothetical protein
MKKKRFPLLEPLLQSLELLITVKDEFIHVSVTETNGAGIALIQPHFSAAPLNV